VLSPSPRPSIRKLDEQQDAVILGRYGDVPDDVAP
jgi:hypothetical protein